VAIAAAYDLVGHRVPVWLGEFTPNVCVAAVAQLDFLLLEKSSPFDAVDLVAVRAPDVVLGVRISLSHVLLMAVLVTTGANPRRNRDVGFRRIGHRVFLRVVLIVIFVAWMTVGTGNDRVVRGRIIGQDLMRRV
jgi:hypothetical protein